jgi:hypothetical protein
MLRIISRLYTHVTSKCFVRRKVGVQSKTQHEVMVIPFSIDATQRWFSTLRPVGQGKLCQSALL